MGVVMKSMDRLFSVCIVICAWWWLPFAATAELYKWVDSKGRTHYSDALPVSVRAPLDYQAPADNRIAPPADIKYSESTSKKKRPKSRRRAKVSCDKYQNRIDKVQKQLRAGYKEPRGNKLRARKRELNDQLRRCRKGLG